MNHFYKQIKNNLLAVKDQHFLQWPLYLQRFLMLVGIFLIYIIFSQLFSPQDEIISNKNKLVELDQKLKMQQDVIYQAKANQKNKDALMLLSRVNASNLSVFVRHISTLAKQNQMDLESIRPLQSKEGEKNSDFNVHSFQISALGSYSSLLNFIHNIGTLPNLAMIDDFQLLASSKEVTRKQPLQLLMIVQLYGK